MEFVPDHRPGASRPPAAWRVVVAWVVILGGCVLFAARPWEAGEASGGDDIGLVVTQLQARYIVGAARIVGGADPMLYSQARGALDAGTVQQRQRFVIIAADLAGPSTARQALDELDALIAEPASGPPPQLDAATQQVHDILHKLYPPALDDAPQGEALRIVREAADALTPEERSHLVESLGWFGELALPGDSHDQALRSAVAVAVVLIGAAGAGVLALCVGFAGLVAGVVLIVTRRMRGGLSPARAPHVLYAETFAIWLVLFMGTQVAIGRLAPEALHMPLIMLAFPMSLGALAWPVLNGAPWSAVRQDVGLTLGRGPVETLFGAGGYLATLPLLGIGVMLTLALMLLQQLLQPEPSTFAPVGGPAHPVIVEMTGPGVWPKLQILLLAAVGAPLVEETMFRGVLYRHLRSASWGMGRAGSIALGTAGNTFLFAMIHPQGAVAIPALMSLATGMTLLREWRGTLLPSMIVHGISNGLVMCLLWALLGM